MITTRQVNDCPAGCRDFINLPYRLYRHDSCWCPPLRWERRQFFSSHNPFMRHARVAYFVTYAHGQPVGRVTAHVDEEYDRFHGTRQGFFGFFESIRDLRVCRQLILAAEEWLRAAGADSIMGPFNFSSNHEIGFLEHGFDRPPVIMMPYTKPYYPALLLELGYERAKLLLSYRLDRNTTAPAVLSPLARRLAVKLGPTFEIRTPTRRNFKRFLDNMLDIYNEAWHQNWGFVPLTRAEIVELAGLLKPIANFDFIYILYKNRQPAACLLTLPDINEALIHLKNGRLLPTGIFKLLWYRRRIKTYRMLLLGVKSRFRKMSLEVLLYDRLFQDALVKTDARVLDMSWVLEDNIHITGPLKKFGIKPYKRHLIVSKSLR